MAESLSQLLGREGLQCCCGCTPTSLCRLFPLLSLRKGRNRRSCSSFPFVLSSALLRPFLVVLRDHSSRRKTAQLRMRPQTPPSPVTAAGLVLWCQRCASVSEQETRSRPPPTTTSGRMAPVYCCAVPPVKCRFMPVSISCSRKAMEGTYTKKVS